MIFADNWVKATAGAILLTIMCGLVQLGAVLDFTSSPFQTHRSHNSYRTYSKVNQETVIRKVGLTESDEVCRTAEERLASPFEVQTFIHYVKCVSIEISKKTLGNSLILYS